MLLITALALPAQAQDDSFTDLRSEADAAALDPLDGYLQEAAANNPDLWARYQAVVAQSQRGAQVGSLPDPEVNLAFFANPPNQAGSVPGRFAVSAMQMFPWFGLRSARRRVEDHRTRAVQRQFEADWLALMGEVQDAYFRYYRAQRAVELTAHQIELLDNLIPIVRARYETARAAGGQADVLRIEMEQEELRVELATLREARAPIRTAFNALLNRPADAPIEVPDALPETAVQVAGQSVGPDAEALTDLVLAHNPSLDALDAQADARRAQVDAARRDGRPRFGLGVEVMGRDFMQMRMMDTMNEGVALMATIQVPLYRDQYRAQRREAAARHRQTQYERTARENALRTAIEKHVQAYRDASRHIVLHRDELLPRAEQALEILREAYISDRALFDEVIRMQRQLLDHALAIVEAQADQHRARARLEALARMPDRPAPDFDANETP